MGKDDSRERLSKLHVECSCTVNVCQDCHQRRVGTVCIYMPCQEHVRGDKIRALVCYKCLLMHYARHDLCADTTRGGMRGDWAQVELDREWAELAMRFYGKQGREASES